MGNQTVDIKDDSEKCQLYKRRWLMLFLFVVCANLSFMQWIEYAIIADSIVEFYNVSYEAVNWTSMILLLLFMPFIFPGVYLINKLGVRQSLLLVNLATCVASWIKVGAASPDRFWVYLLGQTVLGIFQVIFCALPVPVAAVWFGEDEVSTACGLSIFGMQVGLAMGFIVPPMIVHNGPAQETEYELYIMTIGAALLCTLMLIITYLVFEDEPPMPPSPARMKSKEIGKIEFLPSFIRLVKNKSYMVLAVAYGINLGVYCGMSTLLNQIVLYYYPDAAEDAGRIGVITVVAGMFGAILIGIVMDKFHKFKEATLGVFFGCFLSIIAFSFALPHGLSLLYGIAAFIGVFVTGLLPVGYEVAVELTYPEPECISSGLVQIFAQAIGIGFTYLYSYLFYNFGDLVANLTTSGFLLFSTILILFIRFDLRRRKVQVGQKIELPQINSISKDVANAVNY